MRILNFGSLNIDFVYQVDSIVRPGETIASLALEKFGGGKGLNQSIALARAGAQVYHAGLVGEDGEFLRELLRQSGVDTRFVETCDGPSGQAIIQVEKSGQNSIVLYGGANRRLTLDFIDRVLAVFGPEDLLVLQNEVNLLSELIDRAHARGIPIALNPSPMNGELLACDLSKITYFIVNEIEGYELTGKTGREEILDEFARRFPGARVVLTLGKDGAVYRDGDLTCSHGIYRVPVVDTTAAGDTFLGYFLAHIGSHGPKEALRRASLASALAVSVMGAANSIPLLADVLSADLQPASAN